MDDVSKTAQKIANMGYYPFKLYSAIANLTTPEFVKLAELISKVERAYNNDQ